MFFYVINHYKPRAAGPHVVASTVFAAALAVQAPEVSTVLVVDGSEQADPDLKAQLAAFDVRYLHTGQQLTFAQGYNAGLALSDQPWTILAASDIYSNPGLFKEFARIADLADPSIGCVIPTLNNVDLGIQESKVRPRRRTIDMPLMTLNLNAFPTDYLRQIGGVPEEFSGNYNDVVLADRIRKDGRRIVLALASCVHFGTLTLNAGKTNVNADRDREQFQLHYPEYYLAGAPWELDVGPFSSDWRLKVLSRVLRSIPKVARRRVGTTGMRLLIRPFR